jgi:hypothetical protein
MADFISLLKGVPSPDGKSIARTVREAHDQYPGRLAPQRLLKLKVAGGASGQEPYYIIDRKADNAKQ